MWVLIILCGSSIDDSVMLKRCCVSLQCVIVIFSGHTHFLLFADLAVHTMYIPALLLVKVSISIPI